LARGCGLLPGVRRCRSVAGLVPGCGLAPRLRRGLRAPPAVRGACPWPGGLIRPRGAGPGWEHGRGLPVMPESLWDESP